MHWRKSFKLSKSIHVISVRYTFGHIMVSFHAVFDFCRNKITKSSKLSLNTLHASRTGIIHNYCYRTAECCDWNNNKWINKWCTCIDEISLPYLKYRDNYLQSYTYICKYFQIIVIFGINLLDHLNRIFVVAVVVVVVVNF